MQKETQISSFYLKAIFYIGFYATLSASVFIVTTLSFNLYSIFAIVCSMIGFAGIYFSRNTSYKTERSRRLTSTLLWFSSGEALVAILYWTIIKPETQLALWVYLTNFSFCMFIFAAVYDISFSHYFPTAKRKIEEPLPNPLKELPDATQEVIKKGIVWTHKATIIPILGFLLIGSTGYFTSIFYFRDENSDFLLIFLGLGFLVGFTLGLVATYKWQKWARQSGIPEEELKAAAKLAGLWWPKTKRPE